MKIQFINSYGKFHEYNFIREALNGRRVTVYSDTGYAKPATEEIEEYYKEHNIDVVSAKDFSDVGNAYVRIICNLLSGIKMIIKSRKEKYDYCFIHYLSTRRAVLSVFVPSKTKQILITYGSDILRKKNFDEIFFKIMLKRASLIVFNSGNLRYTFEKAYGKKYADKCVDIAFPCASFERLHSSIEKYSRKDACKHFGLPENKKIVVCGHTATEDEQYYKLIDALEKIDESLKKQCHFVFMMTYGSGNYIEYREKVKAKLCESSLLFDVLEEYMGYDEMALLHIASDIHVTSITTDALSLFLLEELYAGAHLVYGEWLHYTEFETNKVGADIYRNFEELPLVMERVIASKGTAAPENQKEIIAGLNDNAVIRRQWAEILED